VPQVDRQILDDLGQLGGLARTEPLGQVGRLQLEEHRLDAVLVLPRDIGLRGGDIRQQGRLGPPRFLAAASVAQLFQPPGDLLARAEDHDRAADLDDVPVAQVPELDVFAINPGAVGALQVGQDHLVVIHLDLGVVAADTFIIQLNRVALLAADRDRRFQVGICASAVSTIENAES